MDKHVFPLGTRVSFNGDSQIYIVADYQELLGPCLKDCKFDHDCYEEAYITVKKEIGTAFPLSQLQYIFDPVTHVGRVPTKEELNHEI